MRIAPILVLDSREFYEPVMAEVVPAIPGIELIGADGQHRPLPNLKLPPDGGRINFPPNPKRWAPQVQAAGHGVGYWREVRGGGLLWEQFWVFYLHNPKKFVGSGDHEGDHEMLQIGYAGEQPVCMTLSQHHNGDGRDWWDVPLSNGRPIICVALGSHAHYFQPRAGNPEVEDVADGKGKVLRDLEWREFGPWATWPGRWGNSQGMGQSPQSPGRQHPRWDRPHVFHTQARTR